MNNDFKNKIVPVLRFPEFQDAEEWEEVSFGTLVKINSGKGFSASEYSNEGIRLLQIENVGYGKTKWNDNTVHLPQKYMVQYPDLLLKKGDIVLALNRPVTNNELKIARLQKEDEPSLLYQRVGKLELLSDSLDKEFIFQLCQISVKDFVIKQSIGSDQPFISIKELYTTKFRIPKLPEQQKIASCLSALDGVITSASQKLAALKTHKQGLMQKLFPAEGETVPQVRFPKFRDSDEWSYMNGDKVFDTISNRNHHSDLPILAITQENGAIPRDEINYSVIVTDKSVESYKVVEIGDFIISLRSFQGGIEYSNYRGICSPAYIILRKKIEVIDSFFKIYFKTNLFIQSLNKNLEGIRDGKMVSYKQFSELLLPIPPLEEQQKIASCLSTLDAYIQTQSDRLAALKAQKTGLMQQLFPTTDLEDSNFASS